MHSFLSKRGPMKEIRKTQTCHCGGVGIEDVSFVDMFLRPQAARRVFVLHDREAYFVPGRILQYCTVVLLISRGVGGAKTEPGDSRRGVREAPQAYTSQRSSMYCSSAVYGKSSTAVSNKSSRRNISYAATRRNAAQPSTLIPR